MENTSDQEAEINAPNISGGKILAYLGVFAVLLTVFLSVQIVPEGHVRTVSTLGEVQETELRPGLAFVAPYVQSTRQYSVQSQTYTMTGGSTDGQLNDDSIEALTTEGLNIEMDVSVRYRLQSENASDLHRNVGTMGQAIEKVIRPTIRSGVRSSTSNFSVNSIYSDKRDDLAREIKQRISKDFNDKGFVVEAVQIRNVMLPEKVRNAIQEKEAAQQMIETKENKIQVEKMEKKRKIVEANAIAEFNKIVGRSINDRYLRYFWIKNLDSHNSVMYVPAGQGGMPIFKDVDSVPKGSGNFSAPVNASPGVAGNVSMPTPGSMAQ